MTKAAAEVKREHKELHFFPGDKRLFLAVDSKLVIDIEAWGGPRFAQRPRPGEPFGATPTPSGRFRIDRLEAYRTNSWGWSKLSWGTRIAAHPTDDHDLVYEAGPGRWRSVRQKTGNAREDVIRRYAELYGIEKVPPTWVFNDFGPVAVRFYADRNNNRKRDANEPLQGEMIHTTPDNEAEGGPDTKLYESHGCVHIRPFDRERMLAIDAFHRGTLLVIHDYEESSGLKR